MKKLLSRNRERHTCSGEGNTEYPRTLDTAQHSQYGTQHTTLKYRKPKYSLILCLLAFVFFINLASAFRVGCGKTRLPRAAEWPGRRHSMYGRSRLRAHHFQGGSHRIDPPCACTLLQRSATPAFQARVLLSPPLEMRKVACGRRSQKGELPSP